MELSALKEILIANRIAKELFDHHAFLGLQNWNSTKFTPRKNRTPAFQHHWVAILFHLVSNIRKRKILTVRFQNLNALIKAITILFLFLITILIMWQQMLMCDVISLCIRKRFCYIPALWQHWVSDEAQFRPRGDWLQSIRRSRRDHSEFSCNSCCHKSTGCFPIGLCDLHTQTLWGTSLYCMLANYNMP